MSIIYVLIPVAMVFVAIAIGVFVWATRSGQFDDLERHGQSILFDEPQMRQTQQHMKDAKSPAPTSDDGSQAPHDPS